MPETRKRTHRRKVAISDALRAMRIRMLVWTFLEVMIIAAAVVFYFYDYPQGFKEFMKTDYWVFALCTVFVRGDRQRRYPL